MHYCDQEKNLKLQFKKQFENNIGHIFFLFHEVKCRIGNAQDLVKYLIPVNKNIATTSDYTESICVFAEKKDIHFSIKKMSNRTCINNRRSSFDTLHVLIAYFHAVVRKHGQIVNYLVLKVMLLN